MKRLRWSSLVLGGATFVAAHFVMAATWTRWFGPEWNPWFLNSPRAVGFTMGCIALAAFVTDLLARNRREMLIHSGNVAAGAIVAMIVILFAVGPGTLFPIAIAIGSILIIASSFAGALIAYLLT